MKNNQVKLGIVGCGKIGFKHLNDFQSLPDCSIAAVADVNETVLKKAAEEYAIPFTSKKYADILDIEDIDGIVVCVPPFLYEEVILASLAAGKHVLCEKPMALSARSAQKMVKQAKKGKLILASCSSRFLFTPTVKKAREMIVSGELGHIYHVTMAGISRRYRPGIEYHQTAKWCLDKSKAGGGALMDWGMYDLNILYGLFDNLEIERVDGFAFHGIDQPDIGKSTFDVEEHGGATLRCNNGMIVFWERAWAAHMTSRPRIKIYGSKAGIAFDPLATGKDIYFEIYEDRSGKPVTVAPDMHLEKWNIHLSLSQDFIEAIQKKHPPKTGGDMVVKFLEVIQGVYRSNQKKTSIKI